MDQSSAFAPTVLHSWRRRQNLVPGLALMALATAGWIYVAYRSTASGSMSDSAMDQTAGGFVFFVGWTAMVMAMMIPATLPLILLYRTVARHQLGSGRSHMRMLVLSGGYLGVWALAGLPIYVYTLFADAAGSTATALPASLLVGAGFYQFTSLKRTCHARCSSPLFFLLQNWREGVTGALRLGLRHGLDCLGCCAGVMVSLVALGMMNVAWMSTAAAAVFVEKTAPGGHRIARPLGAIMIAGGVALLVASALGKLLPGMGMRPM